MVVAQDPQVRGHVHDLDPDLVVDHVPAQGIIVVLDPDQGTVGATLRHLFSSIIYLRLRLSNYTSNIQNHFIHTR